MSKYTLSLPSPSGRSRRRWGTLAAATALGGVRSGGEHRRRREHPADCAEPAGRHRSRGNGRSGHRARRLAAGRRHRHLVHPGRDRRWVLHLDGVRRPGRRRRFRRTVDVQGPGPFRRHVAEPDHRRRGASEPDAILVAPNDVEASAGPLQRPRTPASRSSSSTPPSTTPRSAPPASPRTTSRAAWRPPTPSPT